jgi:hypothetical protein
VTVAPAPFPEGMPAPRGIAEAVAMLRAAASRLIAADPADHAVAEQAEALIKMVRCDMIDTGARAGDIHLPAAPARSPRYEMGFSARPVPPGGSQVVRGLFHPMLTLLERAQHGQLQPVLVAARGFLRPDDVIQ